MSYQESAKSQETAKSLVMQFLAAYAVRDANMCMSLMAKNTPLLILGTNADEAFSSADDMRRSLQRDFDAMSNVKWGEVKHAAVITEEKLASVLLELPISFLANDQEEKINLRYAFTLVKENGEWRIAQAMASVPASSGSYNFSSWG